MDKITPHDLYEAVSGNLKAFSRIKGQSLATLQQIPKELSALVVTPKAVRAVLLALQQQQVPPYLVQQWASFVRRGYFANPDGQPGPATQPIAPIDIEYDLSFEDQIAEIISRLDEIGDLIDGEVTDAEIAIMLQSLEADSN